VNPCDRSSSTTSEAASQVEGEDDGNPNAPVQFAELIFVVNLHGIGAVQWQTLPITHPVQLRRKPRVSPCSRQAGLPHPTEGSFASLFHTVAMTWISPTNLMRRLMLAASSALIDRHGISGGEDWKRRLGNLISEADTVVFVLSPSSAHSEICDWEVEEAARLNKRVLPVNCGPLPATASARA
jgi:hypothetical protein